MTEEAEMHSRFIGAMLATAKARLPESSSSGRMSPVGRWAIATADALMRSVLCRFMKRDYDVPKWAWSTYQRWLYVMGVRSEWFLPRPPQEGSVSAIPAEMPSLSEFWLPSLLKPAEVPERIQAPISESLQGMFLARLCPVAVFVQNPYPLAEHVISLTHGEPETRVAAGVFCTMLQQIIAGVGLRTAIWDALDEAARNHAKPELLAPYQELLRDSWAGERPRKAEVLPLERTLEYLLGRESNDEAWGREHRSAWNEEDITTVACIEGAMSPVQDPAPDDLLNGDDYNMVLTVADDILLTFREDQHIPAAALDALRSRYPRRD